MADPPRRVHFFAGQSLTADDLATEQEYHRGMRYLHNRLHGYGTVSGLDVSVTSGGLLEVSPGLAIDQLGREIVVTAPLTLTLSLPAQPPARRWVRDVAIEWGESPDCPVPGLDGTLEFTRWSEQPELGLVARGRAAATALVLARLTRTGGGTVDVDVSVRRPLSPAEGQSGRA
jgi:hypothetical protein